MLPVDFLPGARRDFDESFAWYTANSAQAAVRFVDAVEAALYAISSNPMQFGTIDDIHRDCPVKKFPFRLVYRLIQNRVLVVAIAHAKRRPGFWKDRG